MPSAVAAETRVAHIAQGDDAIWRGTVIVGAARVDVDRTFGSWRITPEDDAGPYTLLHPDVSAIIQQRVYPMERRAARLRDDANTTTNQPKGTDMSDAATTTPVKQKADAKAAASKNPKGKKPTTKPAAKPAGKPRGEENYKAAIMATPKGEAKAQNANAIASTLSEKRGKKVWPMPTKSHLEKAVADGSVKTKKDSDKTLYYR